MSADELLKQAIPLVLSANTLILTWLVEDAIEQQNH